MSILVRVAGLAAIFALALFLREPVLGVEATPRGVVGAEIAPSAYGSAADAALRSSAQMAADANLGPAAIPEVPFMPTMDPAAYQAAKQQAALVPETAKPGASAPEPLPPATKRARNFNGVDQTVACACRPPDPHGAVGPSNFLQVTNSHLDVWTKTTPTVLQDSMTLNTFFGEGVDFIFDPRAVYDPTWKRWVVVGTRRSTSAADAVRKFYLAVSQTSNPNGAYFSYVVTFDGGPFDAGDWWDYPQLGMDQDALIITGNIFDTPSGGFKGAAMMPIAKARVYNGLGFAAPVFTGLDATLAPPIVLDQNKDAYLVAAASGIDLTIYRGENLSNAGEATLVLQSSMDVTDYSVPPNADQPGTTSDLDTLDARFVNASAQYGDNLWNVHTIALGSYAAPKFYQIDTEGAGANTLKQSDIFFFSATSDDFNASIAANTGDEAFVTWSVTDAAAGLNAQVRITGRQPADALNFMNGVGSLVFQSAGFYAPTGSSVERWGDYSAVSLDPQNYPGVCPPNRRAWITNEKRNAVATWGTRIARIGFC